MVRARWVTLAAAVVSAGLAAACASSGTKAPSAAGGSTRLAVVAAEDFWGSLARQLGGTHVQVESLIANPDTDPHDYEPTPADARSIATAKFVLVNGIGYDPWVDKLLAANPAGGRTVLDVGHVVGLKEGDNPHQWYAPASVEKVIGAITDDYKRLDPAHAADYDQLHATFESVGLGPYHAAINTIDSAYGGTPVGASESIFAPMASSLNLDLVTPAPFLNAISEGTDPTAADKATVDEQIATKAIKVFVFNSQNATPDVQRLVAAAKANRIPVTTVTETLSPQGTTFQDWQTRQLEALRSALAEAVGR
jgi:zinc/manganese transport system substrate-binding protein